MSFESLVNGELLPFYGIDSTRFKLGDTVYEAVEDEEDGYRSYLDTVAVVETNGLIFFEKPIAYVRVQEEPSDEYFKGFILIDEDQRIWLKFGTDILDYYYPLFVFEYTPHG